MAMTRERAEQLLSQPGGTTNLEGILEIHEAMLFLGGCTDDDERAERMEVIRRAHLGQGHPDA